MLGRHALALRPLGVDIGLFLDKYRRMNNVLIASEQLPPMYGAPWLPDLAALVTKAVAMGVLAGAPITDLGAATVQRLVQALQQHGIGADAGVALAPLTRPDAQSAAAPLDAATHQHLLATLHRLHEALEASAAPAVEWPAMRQVFGDEPLTSLLGIAPSSMRRYAGGERATPDEVANRLHWLALVVADLAGAYNHHGIRRWFERPRVQLQGSSPRQVLGDVWSPDDIAAHQLRTLASALTGAPALAP